MKIIKYFFGGCSNYSALERSLFINNNTFSSFEAGNCVSNYSSNELLTYNATGRVQVETKKKDRFITVFPKKADWMEIVTMTDMGCSTYTGVNVYPIRLTPQVVPVCKKNFVNTV